MLRLPPYASRCGAGLRLTRYGYLRVARLLPEVVRGDEVDGRRRGDAAARKDYLTLGNQNRRLPFRRARSRLPYSAVVRRITVIFSYEPHIRVSVTPGLSTRWTRT